LAASATVRQIGPTRVLVPLPIHAIAADKLLRGEIPTELPARAGPRIDEPVLQRIAQVTRFAATDEPEPELEPLGLRSVSYALQNVPPYELRGLVPLAYSTRFALAKIIAPALRRRSMKVASAGGRSLRRVHRRRTWCAYRRCRIDPECHYHTVQRTDELAGLGKIRIFRRSDFQRVRHLGSLSFYPSGCAPCGRRSPTIYD